MLDNLGFGEFFFLALLALLFFGPERLPQIGARLGRWVSNMTQYSKAFMTEWREEALAIHDAVEEVKGIRDEIVAAQREISGTIETARGDMTDGLDAAKDAVTDATRDVTARIQLQRVRAAQDFDQLGEDAPGADPSTSGTDAAITRTQQILTDLEKRRAPSLAAVPPEERAADVAAPETTGVEAAAEKGTMEAPVAETTDGKAPAESEAAASGTAAVSPRDEEWERIHRLIEEGMQSKRSEKEPQAEARDAPAAGPATARIAASSDTGAQGSRTAEDAAPEKLQEEAPEPPKESAFDRTQKVLENLRKRRTGAMEPGPAESEATEVDTEPAAGAETESTPSPPKETAFDRAQQVLQDLKKKREARAQKMPVEVPLPPVNRDDFERLNNEVLELRDQMAALRNELRALRALASQVSAAGDDMPIEEVA
jgi:Sec-independent protein translocase protein TatA